MDTSKQVSWLSVAKIAFFVVFFTAFAGFALLISFQMYSLYKMEDSRRHTSAADTNPFVIVANDEDQIPSARCLATSTRSALQ